MKYFHLKCLVRSVVILFVIVILQRFVFEFHYYSLNYKHLNLYDTKLYLGHQLSFSSERKLYTFDYILTNSSNDITLKNFDDQKNKSSNRSVILSCEHKIFYGYSAIGLNLHPIEAKWQKSLSVVVVTGWERNSKLHKLCCYLLRNGSTICSRPLEKDVRYPEAVLKGVQYKCPVHIPFQEFEKVTICHSVTNAVLKSSVYALNISKDSYMNISSPFTAINGGHDNIAICSKTAYKNVSADVLIEWFELQRFLKVDKVVSYTYHLNTNAMKVLQYYASTGLLSIIDEVDFPEKDTVVRDFGEKNFNQWATEEMTVLDCQVRLYYFKYVAVIDKDEFLLPGVLNGSFSLLDSLNSYFDEKTAGIQLNTKFHLKSWGKSNDSSDLVIGQYINATVPVIDNPKTIIMPSRIHLGSLSIHYVQPHAGLKKFYIHPNKLALHHLRTCRPRYNKLLPSKLPESEIKRVFIDNTTDFLCHGFRRFYQSNVEALISHIKDNVKYVRKTVLNASQKEINGWT